MSLTTTLDIDAEYGELPKVVARQMPPADDLIVAEKVVRTINFNNKRVEVVFVAPLVGKSLGFYSETDSAYIVIVDPNLSRDAKQTEVVARFIETDLERRGYNSNESRAFARRFQNSYILGELGSCVVDG